MSLLKDAKLAVIDSVWGHAGASTLHPDFVVVLLTRLVLTGSWRRGERCGRGVHYKEDTGLLGRLKSDSMPWNESEIEKPYVCDMCMESLDNSMGVPTWATWHSEVSFGLGLVAAEALVRRARSES